MKIANCNCIKDALDITENISMIVGESTIVYTKDNTHEPWSTLKLEANFCTNCGTQYLEI